MSLTTNWVGGPLTVSGAYGRDYKSGKAMLADWNAGKDFIIRSYGPDEGRYINKAEAGKVAVLGRFKSDRNICILSKGVK